MIWKNPENKPMMENAVFVQTAEKLKWSGPVMKRIGERVILKHLHMFSIIKN